jgi:hypothetical protein
MSILKNNSFVPFNNIKIKLHNFEYDSKDYSLDTNNNLNEKKHKNKEKYLHDIYFLQKQDTVLNIIEDLREFDSANGTDIFKNILYLNLYELLYK